MRLGHLTNAIAQKRKEDCKKSEASSWEEALRNIYFPSTKSFLIVVGFVILFGLLAHSGVISEITRGKIAYFSLPVIDIGGNHYQNFIAIHAGVGAIIFALLLFVAESLRDDKTDRARVLLRESHLFPITVAALLVFFIYIWGDINYFGVVPILLLALAVIWSLARLIRVLLNKHLYFQKRTEMLADRLRRSISKAIDERFADIVLNELFSNKSIRLEYRYFANDDSPHYHGFYADRLGTIQDTNLDALKEFADILYEVDTIASSEQEATQPKPVPEKGEERARGFLHMRLNQEVNEKRKMLLSVDTRLVSNQKIERLEKIVPRIFSIGKHDTFSDEIRFELSEVKDQYIQAIKEKKTLELEQIRSIYIKLAETFLEALQSCGGGYSSTQADKERHGLMGGWDQVHWLRSDYADVFEEAMKSKDKDVILEVAFLPMAIARRAVDFDDHYLFQEFIWFAQYLYRHARKQEDSSLKELMIDRSWRYLKEIADFYIDSEFDGKALSDNRLESLKDFSVHYLVIFQDLLKQAFDAKDLKTFQKFRSILFKIFRHLDELRFRSSGEVRSLKSSLSRESPSPEIRASLEKDLERHNFIAKTLKDFLDRRRQLVLGLATWIIFRLGEASDKSEIIPYYRDLEKSLSKELEEFTSLFIQCHDFSVERFWRWDNWEDMPEDEVVTIDTSGKLETFYCIHALQILAANPSKNYHLPPSRDLSFLAEENQLPKRIDTIIESRAKWEPVLTDEMLQQAPRLKQLLTEVKNAQEQKELEAKRSQRISPAKVQEFKEELVKGFQESTILRDIFRQYNLFQDQTGKKYSGPDNRFGLNIVLDKAMFFEEWHVHYVSWSEDLGRDIALAENHDLFKAILEKSASEPGLNIDTALEKITNLSQAIILAQNTHYSTLVSSEKFTPSWHRNLEPEMRGIGGWYKFKNHEIPVFEIFYQRGQAGVVVCDASTIGLFIQYSPLRNGEDPNLVKDVFYMNIQAFSENSELMKQYLEKPPEWLQKVGDHAAQELHLQERVRVHVFEQFEFKVSRDFVGYKLSLS